jgi:hypothetical protein
MIDFSYLISIASVINFDNFVHSSESNVLHKRTIQYSSSVENHINLHIHIISEQFYLNFFFLKGLTECLKKWHQKLNQIAIQKDEALSPRK